MQSILNSASGKVVGMIFSAKSNVTVIDSATLREAEVYARENNLSLILPEEDTELPKGWEMSFLNYNNGNVAFFKYALSEHSLLLKFAKVVVLFPPGKTNVIAA